MQARAIHKQAKISAQNARLVADQIRGRSVEDAMNILKFSTKKAAGLISKVLNSAVANAENNLGADVDALAISAIMVDEGPSLKRMMPRAKGRGNRIVKRSCHIMVEVSDLSYNLKTAGVK